MTYTSCSNNTSNSPLEPDSGQKEHKLAEVIRFPEKSKLKTMPTTPSSHIKSDSAQVGVHESNVLCLKSYKIKRAQQALLNAIASFPVHPIRQYHRDYRQFGMTTSSDIRRLSYD